MAFNFGAPSTTSSGTTGFSFGQANQQAATQAPGFSFGQQAAQSTTTGFSFGQAGSQPNTGFSFGQPTAPTGPAPPTFGQPQVAVVPTQNPSTGFSFGQTAQPASGLNLSQPSAQAVAPTAFSGLGAQAQKPTTGFSFGATPQPSAVANPAAAASSGFSFGTGLGAAPPAFGMAPAATVASAAPVIASTTPAAGFSFGTSSTQPTAPSLSSNLPAASTGFGFGQNKTAAATSATSGLTLGQSANPAGGFNFGGAPTNTATTLAPTGSLSFGLGTTNTVPTGFALGGNAISTPSSTLNLKTTALGSSLAGNQTITSVPTLGLAPAATINAAPTSGFSLPGAANLPTIAPSFAQPLSTGLTGAVKLQTTTGSAGTFAQPLSTGIAVTTPGLTATSSTALSTQSNLTTSIAKMTYQQLEELVNKSMMELEEQEKIFLNQATQVNAWDRLLLANSEKITALNDAVEKPKVDQQSLENELDFMSAQQKELEEMLIPLEKSVETVPNISIQQHADLEREHTYQLAENIDGQLKRMAEDLKEIIEHLNVSTSKKDNNDPIQQISKILNAHMDSLQWIDQNTGLVKRKLDEVSRLCNNQRKEHERTFYS